MISDSIRQIGLFLDGGKNTNPVELARYEPPKREKEVMTMMKNRMVMGYSTARQGRVEFNDLSLLDKDTALGLAYNGYQSGDGASGDGQDSWKSNALRLVERNKVISIAGHAISRLGLLRREATSAGAVPQEEASRVMNTLCTWIFSTFFSRRARLGLMTNCLVAPAGIMHLECHREGEDIEYSFTNVPVDQLYLENFYEPSIQRQGWLVWRQVKSHAFFERKYKNNKNWDKVRKGMHFVESDPNTGFYYVYDSMLQGEMDEELTSYDLDGKMYVSLNGIVMKDGDNPRDDGLYPFVKSGYQLIRENCFYYASLVHIAGYDGRIINSIYPLIIDGAIFNSAPAMAYFGREKVSSDVMIPGSMTSFSDPNAKVMPLMPPFDLNSGLSALQKAEESLNQATDMGAMTPENVNYATAYGISVAEQRRNESLGPFAELIIDLSAQLTTLVSGDVLQFCTLPDVSNLTGNKDLAYKSFLIKQKHGSHERIQFDRLVKDTMAESYKTLQTEWDTGAKTTRVDSIAFRKLKFMTVYSDDILQVKSENLRIALASQTLDKLIAARQAGSTVDMDKAVIDLLLSENEKTAKDPQAYFPKPQPQAPNQPNQANVIPGVPSGMVGTPTAG